uniref:Cadherin domain-containing protein n=1 Tax=Macrostomum lignano TaxID=282301 RepID=A0A1I8FUJ2_9PLAT
NTACMNSPLTPSHGSIQNTACMNSPLTPSHGSIQNTAYMNSPLTPSHGSIQNTAYMNSPLTASPPLLALDQDARRLTTPASSPSTPPRASFSIVSLIDRESLPASQLFVLVKGYQTDKPATRVALALVLVTVGDRNDNAPVMSATDYSATIVENSPAGTFVIGVSATDRDLGENSTVSYLLADPSGAFQIDPNSGHVTVGQRQPAGPGGNARVWSEETATPERFASTPSRLTIRLTDVNDNSPVFANASGISISLDRSVATPGAALHTLVATDADSGINGQLTFSIVFVSVPGAESLFNLDSGSGLLTAAAGLSSAPGDLFVLNVVAEDRAEPSSARRRSTVSLSVRLTSSTSSSASTVATTSSDAVTSSSSQAPTSTTSSSTTSTTTTTTTTSTTSTMATSAAPAESWNASVAASAVWMINDSHATVESYRPGANYRSAPSTSTSGSTSLTTPESVTSLESLNATTYEAATTSETTAAPTEQLVQPAPLGLIVACALLAVIASVLGLLLGWFLFERSRLKALAAERLATIESLQQKTNPSSPTGSTRRRRKSGRS